ncbi:hypothetical protein BH23VER1_BH23VER1_31400 [soil metagenome]
MSLKGFHILFIVLASLISYGFCAWTFWAPGFFVSTLLHVLGVVSGLFGIALTFYGVWFVRKKCRQFTTT